MMYDVRLDAITILVMGFFLGLAIGMMMSILFQHAFSQPILHGFAYGNGSVYSIASNNTCYDYLDESKACHDIVMNITAYYQGLK